MSNSPIPEVSPEMRKLAQKLLLAGADLPIVQAGISPGDPHSYLDQLRRVAARMSSVSDAAQRESEILALLQTSHSIAGMSARLATDFLRLDTALAAWNRGAIEE